MNFFQKTIKSFKDINHRLFWSLFFLGLCPTIYTTVRIFFLGTLPDPGQFSIAAQLEWVNLLFEVVNEAIILPLFFYFGKIIQSKTDVTNRAKTGLLISFCTYTLFAIIIITAIRPLLIWMQADPTIIDKAVDYIRLESVGNICDILFQFSLVIIVTIGKDIYVYILTAVKMIFSILGDVFLTSTLPCSANLGINGIAVSNIIVNFSLFTAVIIILFKKGINIFAKQKMNFKWLKDFGKKAGFSGAESLVRNTAYILMVSRMVNIVSESGTYWVADSFIWAWLIMPVEQLGQLVKQSVAKDANSIRKYTLGYLFATLIIVCAWFITIPAWKPFIQHAMLQEEYEKIYKIILILVGFYVIHAFQNVMDMGFYGLGRIHYMLIETSITNVVYYGIMFALYKTGVWIPTLEGIALMFGGGMVFDGVVSLGVYIFMLKKWHINILDVECKNKNFNKNH